MTEDERIGFDKGFYTKSHGPVIIGGRVSRDPFSRNPWSKNGEKYAYFDRDVWNRPTAKIYVAFIGPFMLYLGHLKR